MKLTTIIIVTLLIFTRINGQREITPCGLLGSNLVPLMTNSVPIDRRWPWHTAIYHWFNEADPTYECGGTVISQNEILTAAHCVSNFGVRMKTKNILVSLGRVRLNESDTNSQFYEVIFNLIIYSNKTSKKVIFQPTST